MRIIVVDQGQTSFQPRPRSPKTVVFDTYREMVRPARYGGREALLMHISAGVATV